MLAQKSDQKLIPTSKGEFLKTRGFTLARTIILKVLGVEVESKNRSKMQQKIDQKLSLNIDGLLASIFGGFWWVLGAKLEWKIEPRAIKNRFKNESKK